MPGVNINVRLLNANEILYKIQTFRLETGNQIGNWQLLHLKITMFKAKNYSVTNES